MTCQEALDLLYDYIDKETSEIDAGEIQKHLDECRDCFEKYRLEQSVQDLIDEKLKVAYPTTQVEGLKIKILKQLDQIDREDEAGGEPRFFRLTARTLVAAASLVVLIGAGLLLASFYRHSDYYVPLERAHGSAASNPGAFENPESTSQLIAAVSRDHDYNISESVLDFVLVGGSVKVVAGTEMCHFVYARANDVISVFVAHADGFDISSDLSESGVRKNNVTFFDHHCRGCRLVYHQSGSLMIITASTNHDIDLLGFIPGVSAI
ncbi:MAG: zf-HC2 domain-containing protein [Candidatus Zixiibacteriota bacterium]|nr:MAG: zf-HC2 domain-containing protein [candidate division Zixibacteria bacterium]